MSFPTTMQEVEAHNARVAAGKISRDHKTAPRLVLSSVVSSHEHALQSPVPAGGNDAVVKKNSTTNSPTAGTVFVELKLCIIGQITGGKNNMVVTRQGRHFPKLQWARWRDTTVASIRSQMPAGWITIAEPCNMTLDYYAGDKRRRDMPAIVDSIFHCLEKSSVVSDDWHIWITESSRFYDPKNPRAEMTISVPPRYSTRDAA